MEEAVKKLADKEPRKLMEMMSMEMTSAGNPLQRKMTSEHISKALDLAAKHDERQYHLRREAQTIDYSETLSGRRYYFAAFVLVLMLAVIILFLFREVPDVLVPVLTGLGGLAGGFMGGMGVCQEPRLASENASCCTLKCWSCCGGLLVRKVLC